MVNLRSVEARLAAVAARLPPPPMRPLAVVIARKYDPADEEPDPHRVDRLGWHYWTYRTPGELAALRERFECEFEANQRPGEPPALFLHLADADEIEGLAAAEVRS